VTPLIPPNTTRCGLLRRLAAITYDGMLLIALLFIAAASTLPFTGGEAVKPHTPWFTLYLLGISYLFFAWFWAHGGQTLGMRAWRIQVIGLDATALTGWQTLIRFLGALLSWLPFLGFGYLWSLFDRNGLAWHDRLSATQLVVIPKPERRS